MSRIVKQHTIKTLPNAGDKQAAILNAAKIRFARYGFTKVTMDEIARDVHMVKGAVYYYFPTKEKIFEAVMQEELDSFLKKAEEMQEIKSPVGKKIQHYVSHRELSMRRLLSLGQLDYETWRKLKPHFQEMLQEFDRKECRFLQRLLEEGNRTGEFTFSNSLRHARLFLDALKGMRLLATLYGNQKEPSYPALDGEIRLFTSLFLKGIQNSK
ncbi:MAG TPA: TetR/AcrR family transcriptional regulator [Bacteroidota bacterium]|nr:TetR/AcrR family transcriptional regulator [Bacteroidota bacterium]